ncbi:MAG TPA: OmpA family protein [Rhizomicrobium sp.]|jgi:outer membrane protein OmpA-like peptidoglycan-associated protein|nr:OmpA family protein [Rhizomicrobium sp.]
MALRAVQILRLVPLAIAAIALSGCLSTSALDDLNDAQPTGSQFTQELFKNYAFLARSFGDVDASGNATFDDEGSMSLSGGDASVGDLANAYAIKALDAAKGLEVPPEPAPDENARTIRQRLVRALQDGRDRFPVDAARAQADYDCMIMDARVPSMLGAAAQCGRSLQQTLGYLEKLINPPPPPPPPAPVASASDYTVYFDFDSWTLTGEDLTVLQNAVNTARAGGQSRISIVGHTDTSGDAGYNQNLSVKRANVVKETLIDMGARAEAIQTSGVGENDLAVATGDGVKEAKNRRAVVTLAP